MRVEPITNGHVKIVITQSDPTVWPLPCSLAIDLIALPHLDTAFHERLIQRFIQGVLELLIIIMIIIHEMEEDVLYFFAYFLPSTLGHARESSIYWNLILQFLSAKYLVCWLIIDYS